ncbi:hypothetical protein E3O57_07995 [Cryobacterium sp. TMN-39-2]|nr:hypothetical protein C3B60_16090 [Cryobacterium zongtaii]TFC45591.1 hypothetical protein E3O57_07995 [Cryobacterium sp. TMN-39-2]
MNLAFNVQVNRALTTGLYLSEVEKLLSATGPGATGESAVVDARWYHKPAVGVPNPTDAGHGFFTVAPARQNTGPGGEIESLGITLTGKGEYEKIANPFTGWSENPAPNLSAVTPPGQGATKQVIITGTGLLGATDVKFGATSATAFTVVSATTVVATIPDGAAGSVNVTVVTPVGTSPVLAYTRIV